jgi:hypothetical protein
MLESAINSVVDSGIILAADILMPFMLLFFCFAVGLRTLIYFTIKREEWFTKEFAKRVNKYMAQRDDSVEQSFYVVCKRLLEITYYEVFEIRSIMKRRNPDAIMTVTDRVFLVQQGSARVVSDSLKQIKFLKWGERPKFLEISNSVLSNNPCFNRVFGILPVSVFNDFLGTVPGLFVVFGIFGTFLGIMKALPELGSMNLNDVEATKAVMDTFLLKISFSMSTSVVGIFFSVTMGLINTFLSCDKVYTESVERLENEFDKIWNMSSNNKLPKDLPAFEADRDPIEVLSEDLISKELAVEIGFTNIIRPISKWWMKVGKPSQAEIESTPEASKIADKDAA